MKILLNNQVIDIDESIESMRNILIENEREGLLDIGCDGLEADEMAHEEFDFLSDEEIKNKIKTLEIQ